MNQKKGDYKSIKPRDRFQGGGQVTQTLKEPTIGGGGGGGRITIWCGGDDPPLKKGVTTSQSSRGTVFGGGQVTQPLREPMVGGWTWCEGVRRVSPQPNQASRSAKRYSGSPVNMGAGAWAGGLQMLLSENSKKKPSGGE